MASLVTKARTPLFTTFPRKIQLASASDSNFPRGTLYGRVLILIKWPPLNGCTDLYIRNRCRREIYRPNLYRRNLYHRRAPEMLIFRISLPANREAAPIIFL